VQDPYGACAGTKEGDIVRFATDRNQRRRLDLQMTWVISSNALAWITLLVDRLKVAIIVTQNPYSARARAVEGEMIKFADVVIIKGKDTIGSGFEVVSSDTDAWVTLLVYGREYTDVMMQNPYGACSRAIETKMVKVSIPIVIEGKGPISGGFEVISTNAIAWITLLVDRREIAIFNTQNPYSGHSRAVEKRDGQVYRCGCN